MKNFGRFLLSIVFVIVGMGISSSVNAQIVISEVYGGGGNSGAPFNADFVELYNQGGAAVNLTGYTIFYKSATGANFSAADSVGLTGTIPAMGYYLVQVSNAGANGAALQNTNQTANIGYAAGSGNVVLTSPMFGLTAPFTCAQVAVAVGVADRVAYGTGDCPETAAAPAGSNSNSVQRTSAVPGFPDADTNDNSVDFVAASPTPSSSSLAPTASAGTVSGTVRSARGRGLKHVVIMISGGSLEEPLYATTNQFGRYSFEDIPVGESYVLSVFSRRYRFDQTNKVISLNGSLTNIDFISAVTGNNRIIGSRR